jgi:mitotic spindle assembly checkpoint protein MAD1
MIDAFQSGEQPAPVNAATQAALDAANATLEAQAAQLANLERDLADAELRVGSGEYNTKIWRCVEFADSPAARDHAIRKETLEKLRGENGALVERIKELEGRVGGGSAGHGMVPRETYDRLKDEFEEKERGHEKRLLRLKEVSLMSPARTTLTSR